MLTSRGSPFLKSTLNGVISTVYVSPGCTPYSVTLVLLVVIGDWSELTLCVIRYWTVGKHDSWTNCNEKVQSTIVFNTPLYSTDHPLYKQCFIVYYVITKDNLWRYKVRFVVYQYVIELARDLTFQVDVQFLTLLSKSSCPQCPIA